MKILNLYAGIGGNRKLWGDEHEVTAVEINESIAKIYKDLFPEDEVIIGDAHQYLLENYKDFDFIWSSPPCPTHSRMCYSFSKRKYPDMSLYEEIIFLKHWFKGTWVVENVVSYYEPLIKPQKISKHFFWSNLKIPTFKGLRPKVRNDKGQTFKVKAKAWDINIKNFHGYKGDKRTLINNCVSNKLGEHILNGI
jgi:DNA (cytosine-5)-methyltransferase 1